MIKKLNSSRGASLIIALVYFVVSMSIGAAILSMALANISRVKAEKKMENSYLAVRSAAELYKSKIANIKVVMSESSILENDIYEYIENKITNDNSLSKQLAKIIYQNIDKNESCQYTLSFGNEDIKTNIKIKMNDIDVSGNNDNDVSGNNDNDVSGNNDNDDEDDDTNGSEIFEDEQKNVTVYADFYIPNATNEQEKICLTVEGKGIIALKVMERIEEQDNSEGETKYDYSLIISVKDFYTYKGQYPAEPSGTGG